MKRLVFVLLLVLVTVLAINTLRVRPAAPPAPGAPLPALNETALAQRLAGAVRIATVSHADVAQNDPKQLETLAAYLQTSFPLMHQKLQREVVNGHSLLYTWKGSDENAAPVLLLAHMDVVPVEPGSESRWTHPPFSGDIADGYIWGRGTLDDKGSLISICEAVELLLAQNVQPRQNVLIAFGQDEEIGGHEGARKIAALLKSRGVHAEWALDEGGMITQGVVPGVSAPVALLLTAEKGYASFRLTTRDVGGHSSRPPPQTAIGRLARAVANVQEQQLPPRLAPPTTDMLARLAPYMPLGQRVAIANRWLFAPLLAHVLAGGDSGNTMVRTTTAPTMINAGIKDNVLPSEAHAVINFRLLPGDSVASVQGHIRAVVDDPAVEIEPYGDSMNDASPVSGTDTRGYALLERSLNEVYPGTIVTPGLVIGATDERNYAGLYDSRYNFAPARFLPEDIERVHGTNERISVKDYALGVQFYLRMLQNLNGG